MAEKTSLSSARSFRSSDFDSTSITSHHKRVKQKIPNKLTQHRTTSIESNNESNNIPESIEFRSQMIDLQPTISQQKTDFVTKFSTPPSSSNSSPPQLAKKESNQTSSRILRSIFFSDTSNSKP